MELLYRDLCKERLPADFLPELVKVAQNLDLNPNWLLCVMKNESSLKAHARNPVSNAAGLIQFMPATAKGLGTTTEKILAMNGVDQLRLVHAYFFPYKKKIKEACDLYTVTFYPYALGKPDSYIIGSEKGEARARLIAKQNPMFDKDKSGLILYGEFKNQIAQHTFKDLPKDQFTKNLNDKRLSAP